MTLIAAQDCRTLARRFESVRSFTERLCEPLEPEDFVVQSMPDVSPTRWHIAHVTWFFETFVLVPHAAGYRPSHPQFNYLFNSYYNAVGEQFPRPQRGLLTRPTVREIFDYRAHVDAAMRRWLESGACPEPALELVELGLHHEQQHQELMLMDIKHVFSRNPLFPAYGGRQPRGAVAAAVAPALDWIGHDGGELWIGHDGPGFSYDNERPRHRQLVPAFELASRLVTNGEFLEFVDDGGYRAAQLWLADGWSRVREEGWQAPLYWVEREGERHEFTLGGLRRLDPDAPVCHVSFYEAEAFARWAGARLPGEAEWETAAAPLPVGGNFADDGLFHPQPAHDDAVPAQLFGDVWEWTASPYSPYPGFRAAAGAVGEYNGKFMCNQFVLRGGACVTSRSHVRATYRNFFYPHCRWQFSGIRLARDAS